MLLAGKFQIGHRETLGLHSFVHGARLVWRDDFILRTLEENERTSEEVGEVNRRARHVQVRRAG